MSNGERFGINLQPRDFAFLRGLFESRTMTLAHAAALYFDSKGEMAKKRVQKLTAAALVRERPRQFGDPSILSLTRRSLELLQVHGHLADYPPIPIPDLDKRARVSDLTLRHELQVMDVKVSVVRAINRTGQFNVAEFTTWPALGQFKACQSRGKRVTIRPDGFIRINEEDVAGGSLVQDFFLELDRSTESLEVLADRCHCYLEYYRSGGFAVRNGGTRDAFKNYPFRVLIVCKSQQRCDNIARRLLENNPPILNRVWLATLEAVQQEPLGRIWKCPADGRSPASVPLREMLY